MLAYSCARAATALQLEQVLREREGIRAAAFTKVCRSSNVTALPPALPKKDIGAQVLLVPRNRF
ncbi:hypothetical protein ACNKHT_00385 [Shigella flexneri]